MEGLIVNDLKGLYQKIKDEVLGGYDPKFGPETVKTSGNFLDFIVGYAYRSNALNEVMEKLRIKQYCVKRCPKRPKKIGCCTNSLYYKYGIEDPTFLALQEIEARENGWKKDASSEQGQCLYHQKTGCSLNYFKPPQCLGQLCGKVSEARIGTDDIGFGEKFSERMFQVKELLKEDVPLVPGNYARVLETMDSAITIGRILVKLGWPSLIQD